jgi:hypothetical protein
MKTILFSAVLCAATPAFAGFQETPGGTECTSHMETNGDVTTTCNRTPGTVTWDFTPPPHEETYEEWQARQPKPVCGLRKLLPFMPCLP